ncbi:ABC transporter ATP-binding protein [Enterocloster lavalensis]|uniref:ABC transporter ATP-binding protein n=1 Tax=Enterocloster lavalensis TaxID=460384 RepID=UPI002FD9941A
MAHLFFPCGLLLHAGKEKSVGHQLCLKRGETLGIVGATGAGKSTLLKLLLRFYDATGGTVRISGRDIRSYGLTELREKFGVVFQNDVIFKDSILENIRLRRDLTPEAVDKALKTAQAEEFVRGKSGELEEALNIRGANLSGGQKQRLLIARALAGAPEILILDDSSSALDYRTDARLRAALARLYPGTTKVIVAQRVSSILHADRILVLQNGRAAGLGNHEQLLADCEVYRRIVRSQMGA